ncbi:MAG: hypothetical protein ACFE8E_10470 [Candidatus Hodarchaeota archaeon]
MELIEEKIESQNDEINESMPISIKCPVCKLKKDLKFPKSVINQAKQLTTISIPKGLICQHHFQAFVDKNFAVRGYQKVDFEYASDLFKSKNSFRKEVNGKEFSEYIIIEENYLAYKPKENQIIIEKKENKMDFEDFSKKKSQLAKVRIKSLNKKYGMNREDVYNEFWDFIEENNKDFQDFIKNDDRRNKMEKFY